MPFKILCASNDAPEMKSLRIGHATNSSSLHAVIYHAGSKIALENTPFQELRTACDYVLTEKRDKAMYIFASDQERWNNAHQRIHLAPVLERHGLPVSIIADAQHYADWVGGEALNTLEEVEKVGISLADWLDFMLSDNIAFANYDEDDYPAAAFLREGHGFDLENPVKWRKDGDAIVAYESMWGTKVRWSRSEYEKSLTPELVDVKITDYCAFDCAFCYQGSTRGGQHAPLQRIEAIFDELAQMGVFEVAIGGGEPCLHPQFAEIIQAATTRGLTFNFTSYGLSWLQDKAVIAAMEQHHFGAGSGVGISVHSKRDIAKIERAKTSCLNHKLWHLEIMAQTVVGAAPYTTLEPLLRQCISNHVPLLLLGYKDTGRGIDFAKQQVSDAQMREFLELARNAVDAMDTYDRKHFRLSVDTAFLDHYGHVLDEMQVPHLLRSSPEGKFSMYIDAVTDHCGPSSYCDASQMAPRSDIQAQFATY